MTEAERQEFIYDLAHHKLKKTSKAGIFALALDRQIDLLSRNTDDVLLAMAPDNLNIVKARPKKAKGF